MFSCQNPIMPFGPLGFSSVWKYIAFYKKKSSMIHSAWPTVSQVAANVFCSFVFLDLKNCDWRTDKRTDNMCENNDHCGLAEWINLKKRSRCQMFSNKLFQKFLSQILTTIINLISCNVKNALSLLIFCNNNGIMLYEL